MRPAQVQAPDPILVQIRTQMQQPMRQPQHQPMSADRCGMLQEHHSEGTKTSAARNHQAAFKNMWHFREGSIV